MTRSGGDFSVGERRVVFAGASNFRDLGGYPVTDGRQTTWAQVYRSDSLHRLTAEDLEVFSGLGIATIYDLRRHDECEREPGPLPCLNLEMPSGRVSDPMHLRTRAEAERWLCEDYCQMIADAGPIFGRIFADLAGASPGPAVFHCAGGKDRTGITAALLLSALEVDRDTVLDDYELTTSCFGAEATERVVETFVAAGMARPAAEGMLSTPRWAMSEALGVLDSNYGGIENYLLGPCGLHPGQVTGLRSRLVQ